MKRIEQNEKLRERIVDLAELWDGKESLKYGMRLTELLKELGIKDIPKYYSMEFSKITSTAHVKEESDPTN